MVADAAVPLNPKDRVGLGTDGSASSETALGYAPLERPRRLPDEIAHRIVGDIGTGRLRPGDRLPTENQLAAAFGVARTVIREAVSLLKFDGWLEARPALGTFVAESDKRNAFRISPECFAKRIELRQILELCTAVQSEAAALAARHRSDEQLRAISGALERMVRAGQAGTEGLEDRARSESAFYRAIADASMNSYFREFITYLDNRVRSQLHSVHLKHIRAAELGEPVIREHEAVYRAIRDRDVDRARTAARSHFEASAQRLVARGDFVD